MLYLKDIYFYVEFFKHTTYLKHYCFLIYLYFILFVSFYLYKMTIMYNLMVPIHITVNTINSIKSLAQYCIILSGSLVNIKCKRKNYLKLYMQMANINNKITYISTYLKLTTSRIHIYNIYIPGTYIN